MPLAEWRAALTKNWDPKRDFALAMLHAERLTRLLADEAIAELLLAQAKAHPERRELLERWLERAELALPRPPRGDHDDRRAYPREPRAPEGARRGGGVSAWRLAHVTSLEQGPVLRGARARGASPRCCRGRGTRAHGAADAPGPWIEARAAAAAGGARP